MPNRRLGWVRSREPPAYLLKHSWQIIKYPLIRKSQNFVSKFSEPPVTLFIIRSLQGVSMVFPIQLNYQALRRTVKISDISFDAMLPPEFSPVKTAAAQSFPQHYFGRCGSFPQLAPGACQGWNVFYLAFAHGINIR